MGPFAKVHCCGNFFKKRVCRDRQKAIEYLWQDTFCWGLRDDFYPKFYFPKRFHIHSFLWKIKGSLTWSKSSNLRKVVLDGLQSVPAVSSQTLTLIIHDPCYNEIHFMRAHSFQSNLFTVELFLHAFFSQEESTSKMVSISLYKTCRECGITEISFSF